jgi:hypothetical protein
MRRLKEARKLGTHTKEQWRGFKPLPWDAHEAQKQAAARNQQRFRRQKLKRIEIDALWFGGRTQPILLSSRVFLASTRAG